MLALDEFVVAKIREEADKSQNRSNTRITVSWTNRSDNVRG
jgi:hypothetical protein